MKKRIDEIIIPNSYKFSNPNQNKINTTIDYMKRHGDCVKNIKLYNGILVDGYIKYLACRSLGIECVDAEETDDPHNILQEEYVICKFDGCDKLYVWRNKDKFSIDVGDYAVVVNADGQLEEVQIVQCIQSDSKSMLRHKNIVGIQKHEKSS